MVEILRQDGTKFYGEGYTFVPGKDEIIREGTAGYILSFGDAVYRCLDAVEKLKVLDIARPSLQDPPCMHWVHLTGRGVTPVQAEGLDVGLINKPTLNVIDEETMKLVVSERANVPYSTAHDDSS